MIEREVEGLKVEVRHLREGQAELKDEIKQLRKALEDITHVITEYKLGKRWLFAMFTGAATLGALIDYICRLIKLY